MHDLVFACRYVLSRIESSAGVRKGARIWHLSFGGGFKVCSCSAESMQGMFNPGCKRSKLSFQPVNDIKFCLCLIKFLKFLMLVQVNTAVWKAKRNIKADHPCWK